MAHSPVKTLNLVGQGNALYGFMLKFNLKRKAFDLTGKRNTNQKSGFSVIELWRQYQGRTMPGLLMSC